MKIENILAFTLALFLVAAVMYGCQQAVPGSDGGDNGGQTVTTPGTYDDTVFDLGKDITTKTFSSDAELLNFIKDHESTGYYSSGYMLKGGLVMETMAVDTDSAALGVPTAVPQAADVERDFSETNVQVAGVDEADIIKTDGNYIYTISERVLYIIKAYPGEDAEVLSTIKLESTPESLFIDGDTLAVFGNVQGSDFYDKVNFQPRYGMTFVNIYDISDKKYPKLEKDYKYEGTYFRGRMVDGYAYILTSTSLYDRPIPMPVIFDGTTRTSISVENIYYYDISYDNPVFVNIHALNMDTYDVSSKSVAVESSQHLYMSEDNIYITYTEYINEWELQKEITMDVLDPKLSPADKVLIEKIKSVDNDILSGYEKESKIYQVYERFLYGLTQSEQDDLQDEIQLKLMNKLEEYEYFEFTVINKVNVEGPVITPVANAKVPGSVLNQFSMDENNNVFRIATTISPRWSSFEKQRATSTNNVYALDENLEMLGGLAGLAENEQIFSTRFIEDRLYMVTFRQVDPFFVIDLSIPEDIKELGQLKIPGFSRYLHPYDENTIIGIGRDATETGRNQGLKISLFDVSDVENPEEVAKYVTESRYVQSTAEYEHRAFLFSKEKNLLVIPAYNYNWEDSSENYNGAFVFNISKQAIELRGLVDHSKGSTEMYWMPYVERSLYIEELLYTKSAGLLRINRIDNLKSVKDITLEYRDVKIPIY